MHFVTRLNDDFVTRLSEGTSNAMIKAEYLMANFLVGEDNFPLSSEDHL